MKLKFEFEEADAQTLLDGLQELPFRRVRALIEDFLKQVQENKEPKDASE
jgi:hypothetical protein